MTDNSQYPTPEELGKRAASRSESAKQKETSARERTEDASRTKSSALVQRIALRTGKSAEEIASKIPEDTLRRTKYPVIEERDDNGNLIFKEPKVIIDGDGRKGLVKR